MINTKDHYGEFVQQFLALSTAFFALSFAPPSYAQQPSSTPMQQTMMPMKNTDTSFIKRKWLDIAYGHASPAQQLDIYLPNEGKGPFPVIIAIHGGAFEGGDKQDGQLNGPIEGVKRGYAVVSINYRLSKEATFPAATQDVESAIRFIKAHAAQYQLDAQHIAAWGDSAGANLAAWAGAAGKTNDTRVQAVVDWFGPIDFAAMDAQFKESGNGTPNHSAKDSPESRYIGQALAAAPDLVMATNPERYLDNKIPPFFIQHGSKDPIVPTQQSMHFAKEIAKVAGQDKVTFEIIEGARHGGPQFETPQNLDKVFAFLDRYLKP